ncbi:MAG: carbohydrate kinase [Verrucomicrobia bacterium TMED71]|nr:MAG: carbohydrate kinase [Verrucomicrobia bacterium TMED71]
MINHQPIAVGLGELLWDMLPKGKQIGGAPFNFARHCNQLGLEGFPVSQIGIDELGNETVSLLKDWGITPDFVSRDPQHETGTVNIRLDNQGKPNYEIRDDAAWDFIQHNLLLEQLAPKVDIVCFGTLAQRSDASRFTIYSFLDRMSSDAIKLFDVNLRQHFYSIGSIEASLERASILKLSDEELPVLKNAFSLSGSVEVQLSELKNRFELKLIAYTRGAEGSLLIDGSGTDDHPGNTITTIDTIGAGDSFSATLCAGLLQGLPLAQLNENANQVAAYVCSQRGATPALPESIVKNVSYSTSSVPKI